MENHCRILAWRIPRTDRACWTVVHGVTRVGDECVTNIFFQWIKDCSWMKLEHLLFARAQIERLQELHLFGCRGKEQGCWNLGSNQGPLDLQSKRSAN